MHRSSTVAVAVSACALAGALGASAQADPIVTSGAGASPAAVQPAVDAFRAQLGTLNPNVGGSQPAGRREINWDGVPNGSASPTPLPFDFFNSASPRGVLFTSADGRAGRVLVSSTVPGSELFRDVEPTYAGLFTTFSAPRIFASQNVPAIGDASVDVLFRVPGTGVAATTNAFGVVFTGVNQANSTFLQFFSADGRNLGSYTAPTGTLSFVGVRYDRDERIALVRVHAGDRRLAPGLRQDASTDLVAMDDFVYGEPQQLATSGESFESGLGSFTATQLDGRAGLPRFAVTTEDARAGTSSASVAGANEVADMALTSAPVAIRGGGPSTLTFFHRDSSEREFDGGLVEVSTDDGASWTEPTPAQWLENGPAVRITSGFRSPIIGRLAFSGASAGFARSVLDLAPYAGRTIRYRFRFASDQSIASRGWFVDDVTVATPPEPPAPRPPPAPGPRPPVQPGPGPRPGPRAGAAALTALSVSPSAFAVNRRGRIRFTLSTAATVRFTLARVVRGRRVRGACRVPAPRRGAPCTRAVTLGSFTAAGRAGGNSLAFPARVGGRSVGPGTYRLTGSVGSGSRSATVTVRRAARRRARR